MVFLQMENETTVFKELSSQEADIQNQIFELKRVSLTQKDFEDGKHLIRQQIEALRKKINTLEGLLRGQQADEEIVIKFVNKHDSTLRGLISLLRQATLEFKDSQQQRSVDERESLLETNEATIIKQRKLKTKQELLSTSNKLTDILERTSNRMLTETHKSSAILEELGNSSITIEKTLQGHKELTTSIHIGKRFLNKLKQRDFTDKLLLVFALLFFFSVILYILKSRLNL